MFKSIAIGFVVVLLVLVVAVASGPSDFSVERSATVAAPVDVVYGQVADFRRWEAWSPWEKLDPTMKKTYGGVETGAGATYAWEGSGDVGEGRMAIVEAAPGERIEIELEFIKPFAAKNQTTFRFEAEGEKTTVSWRMAGERNFAAKAISLFMSMDKMIGGDFEKGLAALGDAAVAEAKKQAEAAAQAAAEAEAEAEAAAELPVADE